MTGVDITPELIALGAQKAEAAGVDINWVTADASDTGLPGGSFDAVVSNMGIIFVEPARQVAEIARLLRPGGVLGFSSWVPDRDTPFYKPIVAVLGTPPASEYSPDQWGMAETSPQTGSPWTSTTSRSKQASAHGNWEPSTTRCTCWRTSRRYMSPCSATSTRPSATSCLPPSSDAMRANVAADGHVAFDAPYVVVTALRR